MCWPAAGLANIYEGACLNCLKLSKKSFRVPMEILKSHLQLLLITALLSLMYITIIYFLHSTFMTLLIKTSSKNMARKKIWR